MRNTWGWPSDLSTQRSIGQHRKIGRCRPTFLGRFPERLAYVQALSWRTSNGEFLISPATLDGLLTIFREEDRNLNRKRGILEKRFQGVYQIDPAIMDLGSRNELRLLRTMYPVVFGTPLGAGGGRAPWDDSGRKCMAKSLARRGQRG